MQCVKTGVVVLFGDSHAYPGDEFKCPSCGAWVIVTNPSSVFLPPNEHHKHTVFQMPI